MIKYYSIQIAMAVMTICELIKPTNTWWLVIGLIGLAITTLGNYIAEVNDAKRSKNE